MLFRSSDEASFTDSEFDEDENTSSKKVHLLSTIQQESPDNDEGSTFSGQIKNTQIKVSYLDNERRHETAFIATCLAEINDIDKDKRIKKVSTRPPDTVKTSAIYHQKNLKEHMGQEQAMNNINMYHKTILDYAKHSHKNDAIHNCRYNHNDMVG